MFVLSLSGKQMLDHVSELVEVEELPDQELPNEEQPPGLGGDSNLPQVDGGGNNRAVGAAR